MLKMKRKGRGEGERKVELRRSNASGRHQDRRTKRTRTRATRMWQSMKDERTRDNVDDDG